MHVHALCCTQRSLCRSAVQLVSQATSSVFTYRRTAVAAVSDAERRQARRQAVARPRRPVGVVPEGEAHVVRLGERHDEVARILH